MESPAVPVIPKPTLATVASETPAFPVSEWVDDAASRLGLRSLHGLSKREFGAVLIFASMMRPPQPALTVEARSLRAKEAILAADELFRQLENGVPE